MKFPMIIIILVLLWSCSNSGSQSEASNSNETHHAEHTAPQATDDENKPKSPAQMAMSNIGNSHVHIEYNAPSKRGRVIFGGLVAYDEVWVTGAHNATSISFSEDVNIGDTPIAAGKYGLFTIPGTDEWTIIINTNWDQHLADDYDPQQDVVRIKVKPVMLAEPVETLTFAVTGKGEKDGTVSISWDKVKAGFDVSDQ